jgi:hypothetical protein
MTGRDRKSADTVLVALLAGGATREEAARKAGVSEATVYRRLGDPAFRASIDEARAEFVARVSAMLTAAGVTAAETLVALLAAESDVVKLGAATRILELGGKFRTDEQIEARLSALEARLAPESEDGRPRQRAAWQ